MKRYILWQLTAWGLGAALMALTAPQGHTLEPSRFVGMAGAVLIAHWIGWLGHRCG